MASTFRVTLLGTGVPIPSAERFGPATLIEAGDHTILIDAGRGATIRLFQIGVSIGKIDALLLTHSIPTTRRAFRTFGSRAGWVLISARDRNRFTSSVRPEPRS